MNSKGFTLVEAIVTGALASVIAVTAYTVFQMNNQQAQSASLHSMLNMQYETAMQQIGSTIRFSNVALQPAETWPPSSGLTAVTGVPAIYLKNAAGADTGGYQITGGKLQERILTGGVWTWRDFTVGNATILLTNTSGFNLSTDRKTITLNLNACGSYKNFKDTVLTRGELFLCRN